MTSDDAQHERRLSPDAKRLLLLDLWEDLDALEAFAEGRPSRALRSPPLWVATAEPTGERTADVLQRWLVVFRDEIRNVQGVRNSIAHALPVTDQQVDRALYEAGRLWTFALLGLSPAGAQVEDARVNAALALHAA